MASIVISKSPALHISSGSSLKSADRCLGPAKLAFSSKSISQNQRRALTIQANFSDGGRQGNSNVFIGGFVLGGLIVGTLGAVYAPQISKALTGADKKDLMKKLPKFLYDEEKALEKQRQKLTAKIEQLNSAIDNVSNTLRTDEDSSNGAQAVSAEDIEAIV